MSARRQVEQLLKFIDASPSPWHAVASVETQLLSFQFVKLDEADKWPLKPGGRYYVVRDYSSIIAFVMGQKPLLETGFKIIGAHTDSPGLRVKPQPVTGIDGLLRLGVEVYGGPILATFTDRDLSLAGRVVYKNNQGHIDSQLIKFDRPLLRLPNLAIHMNRTVNEEGLKLHKQFELPLILSQLSEQQLPQDYFLALLQQQVGVEATRLLTWELNVYDTQKGALWGAEQEFYADSQLDNLASCHAALQALIDDSVLNAEATLVCGLFDHEEIGSESNKGADGSFLPDVLQRIAWSQQIQGEDLIRSYAKSFMISADMAHAYQPNFPNAYDPEHKIMVNEGPVIKINVNQRYSSESVSAAQFAGWCEQAGVPYQTYSHRCDLACGSTIGPMVSARLGIRSVDVGSPLWAMHSIRECAGVSDHDYLIKVLKTFLVN
ncbi:MAG: M18 family aminopeptidase [Methylococcaceae bacterium]|nr:M18 family aminopeptidase [Methylococcaceae bacterium]MDZ4155324.1 M18 family aminopeptidase [Methylococcales bacterium]MDP2393936.1 M18 family aminopeptidase [Methylococcaceae bacterium]MDP3018076.1 M18 family aminopeptidase [Methylococcaceae bacterium]MDP3391813.1 M18 family aminopeptidase [Methylococcaceae bacterium]